MERSIFKNLKCCPFCHMDFSRFWEAEVLDSAILFHAIEKHAIEYVAFKKLIFTEGIDESVQLTTANETNPMSRKASELNGSTKNTASFLVEGVSKFEYELLPEESNKEDTNDLSEGEINDTTGSECSDPKLIIHESYTESISSIDATSFRDGFIERKKNSIHIDSKENNKCHAVDTFDSIDKMAIPEYSKSPVTSAEYPNISSRVDKNYPETKMSPSADEMDLEELSAISKALCKNLDLPIENLCSKPKKRSKSKKKRKKRKRERSNSVDSARSTSVTEGTPNKNRKNDIDNISVSDAIGDIGSKSLPLENSFQNIGPADNMEESKKRAKRTEHRIIVENLSCHVTRKDLREFMSKAGNVVFTDILRKPHTCTIQGKVEYSTEKDMENAVRILNGRYLYGKRIELNEKQICTAHLRSSSEEQRENRSKSRESSTDESTMKLNSSTSQHVEDRIFARIVEKIRKNSVQSDATDMHSNAENKSAPSDESPENNSNIKATTNDFGNSIDSQNNKERTGICKENTSLPLLQETRETWKTVSSELP